MKSLSLKKIYTLAFLAGSLLAYDSHAAASPDGIVVEMMGDPDPTSEDIARARVAATPRTPSCWNCWGCCSAGAEETFRGVATAGATFVNVVAERGHVILDMYEGLTGKAAPKGLRDVVDIAEGTNNELKVVFNPKTGTFFTWDESRDRLVGRFVSAAEIKYRELKPRIHPAGRLAIRYFFDHATELVAGTEAVAKDPSGLLRMVQSAESALVGMFERDMDPSRTRLRHIAGSLRLVDADGDGERDDLITKRVQ